jgi:hypothetical protein
MARRDLPGRDPYPQFEPMVWHGGAERERHVSLRKGDALFLLGMVVVGLLLLAYVVWAG